jgi:NAD-dependent dihydropyrimidine dehydrogenase PreA subunit
MSLHEGLPFSGDGNGSVQRKIVLIDENRCDGCGQCVPSCAEGAIQLIDGKARLISDRLCDGLGACLGHCPRGAIRLEERESEPFDEQMAAAQSSRSKRNPIRGSGCPSAQLLDFPPPAGTPRTDVALSLSTPGSLRHWPVQLRLIPPAAPFLAGADLLVCATCVPVALPDFHARLLQGHAVAIACPKLDDQTGYLEKLTAMFAGAGLNSVTVARVTVPCCAGLLRLVRRARDLAGSTLPVTDMVIRPDGHMTEASTDPAGPEQALTHIIS